MEQLINIATAEALDVQRLGQQEMNGKPECHHAINTGFLTKPAGIAGIPRVK